MKEKNDKGFWERLLTIDRRVLYWILVVIIVIPLIRPIGLPIPIRETTRTFYEKLESVPDGRVVVLELSAGTRAWGEIGPAVIVVSKYLATRNLKIIIWSATMADAPLLAQRYVIPELEKAGKKYGVDYVLVGYVPGETITIATLAKDIHYPKKDFYGTNLADIQLLKDVKTAEDVDLVIVTESGAEGTIYVGQWYAPYKTDLVTVCTGILVPDRMIYYNAGQIKGMVPGARGAGELELLTGYLGVGIAIVDVLSSTHAYLLILIVLCNVGYFYGKMRARREKK